MNFHIPVVIKQGTRLPDFMVHNNELVVPKKLLTKEEYPHLPSDLVKISGKDGRNHFVPLTKLSLISEKDQ